MGTWAAANFLFDLALLWATARLRAWCVPFQRLALGAALGTAYFLVVPASGSPLAVAGSLSSASILMLQGAFRTRSVKGLAAVGATFYAVAFAGAGAGALASGLLADSSSQQSATAAAAAAALAAIAAMAVVGGRHARRTALLAAFRAEVAVRFGASQAVLPGLIDTGNRLREPVGGLPVVLAHPRALKGVLPEALRPIVTELASGRLDEAGRLAILEPRWAARFRLVPFRSVGTRHGLLVGLRADGLEVRLAGGPAVHVGPAVVALTADGLGEDGEFEALVPAECVTSGLATATPLPGRRRPSLWRGGALGAASGS